MKRYKRPNSKHGTEIFSLRLPVALLKTIKEESKRQGRNYSHVVIEALEEKFLNPVESKFD